MTRPEPKTELIVAWCPRCVTAAPHEANAHEWAAAHAKDHGHRALVREKLLTVYQPEIHMEDNR